MQKNIYIYEKNKKIEVFDYLIAAIFNFSSPANTKHLHSFCTTSAQRLRRWADVVQKLYKCFVLTFSIIGFKFVWKQTTSAQH